MKTKLGIIGPKDSVDMICKVAEEFGDRVIPVPYIYNNIEETVEFIKNGETQVDVWLFSGQVPFAIANQKKLRHQAFYLQLNGSSLAKVLLDISYKDGKQLERLSFDTISGEEVYETFSELQLNASELHLLPFSGYMPINEITTFHYDLYQKGKVDACVTCIHSVYRELKSRGVPAYRLIPTKMIIRQTISMACQQGETIHFKHSQIVVLLIQIQDMDKLVGENSVSYNAHRLNLKLQELVIDFTEAMSGSFVNVGIGKFMIFSTRGAFERGSKYQTTALLEKLTLLTGLTANIGIGYGTTSLGAERNAYFALNHARNHRSNCAMLVDEQGSIEGPLENPNSLTYSYRTDNAALNERLRTAGVNISTFNKILAVQDNMGRQSISAADVAEWLNMTQRNARRILSDLEKEGLAREIGEETPATRGRPRKIYRVGLLAEQTDEQHGKIQHG
jgi:hypothetical protein